MKTLKKIFFVSFLFGSLLTSSLLVQGQKTTANNNDCDCTVKPYISAGDDATICNVSEFVTQGASSYQGGITFWNTSGDGVFTILKGINTVYTPGPDDIRNGQVMLTLVFVSETLKTNQPIQDYMILHINNCVATHDDMD